MATGLKLQEITVNPDWEVSGEHTDTKSFTLEARFIDERAGTRPTFAFMFDEGASTDAVVSKLRMMADMIEGSELKPLAFS